MKQIKLIHLGKQLCVPRRIAPSRRRSAAPCPAPLRASAPFRISSRRVAPARASTPSLRRLQQRRRHDREHQDRARRDGAHGPLPARRPVSARGAEWGGRQQQETGVRVGAGPCSAADGRAGRPGVWPVPAALAAAAAADDDDDDDDDDDWTHRRQWQCHCRRRRRLRHRRRRRFRCLAAPSCELRAPAFFFSVTPPTHAATLLLAGARGVRRGLGSSRAVSGRVECAR